MGSAPVDRALRAATGRRGAHQRGGSHGQQETDITSHRRACRARSCEPARRQETQGTGGFCVVAGKHQAPPQRLIGRPRRDGAVHEPQDPVAPSSRAPLDTPSQKKGRHSGRPAGRRVCGKIVCSENGGGGPPCPPDSCRHRGLHPPMHTPQFSWCRVNRRFRSTPRRQEIFPLPPGEDEGEGMRYSSTTCSDCVLAPTRRAHLVEAIISSPHLASPGGRGTHHKTSCARPRRDG